MTSARNIWWIKVAQALINSVPAALERRGAAGKLYGGILDIQEDCLLHVLIIFLHPHMQTKCQNELVTFFL